MDKPLPAGNNIVFDENGLPANYYGPPVTAESIKTALIKSGADPYIAVEDHEGFISQTERAYEGKPVAEVAIKKLWQRAGQGDMQATKEVLDRTVGKPKQTIEQTGTIQLSFQEWIDQRIQTNPSFLIESTPSGPNPFYEAMQDVQIADPEEPLASDVRGDKFKFDF